MTETARFYMALVVSGRQGGDVAMEDADPTMCLARLIQVMLHTRAERCSITMGGGRRGGGPGEGKGGGGVWGICWNRSSRELLAKLRFSSWCEGRGHVLRRAQSCVHMKTLI